MPVRLSPSRHRFSGLGTSHFYLEWVEADHGPHAKRFDGGDEALTRRACCLVGGIGDNLIEGAGRASGD